MNVTDPRLLIWRYRVLITVAAIVLGFIAGLSLPVDLSLDSKLAISIGSSEKGGNSDSNKSKDKELSDEKKPNHPKSDGKVAAQTVKPRSFSVPAQFQGKILEEVQVKPGNKVVALTFDDGPWPETTVQILNILKKNNVKATFFVVGRNVSNYPQLMGQIVVDGHEVGNHTWSHQYHHHSPVSAASEIDKTSDVIYKTTGVKTSIFRPPGGFLNNGLVASAKQKKNAVIMWSADSSDWRGKNLTVQRLADNVLNATQPGGIVLMHDGGGDRSHTVQALPQLIAKLRGQGYKFVTVSELLKMEVKPSPAKPANSQPKSANKSQTNPPNPAPKQPQANPVKHSE
ncbi:MAG TPA: polysaccharide deacetylase family protein [Cyanobacteria bacterium UBA11149]|nr:polysaccharide deacetylase family protein [Cyanobacteria bacterium UBA11366]HBK64011.1 polysaccharide deacetylase family protein [Cyanobacteria bacterium UBA11166]HBR75102.1 polysaccharide deacetylase family protein [Cyanobacteria bacterium UBA11159]HBS69173.1 polysaccharide deacetylase family protein [Cyanobacteria bacterium UBA11153]HBW90930.1 polysaccharide deacetylase family protein [Cyanobacteria bacterium UBA11149]HCA93562.1 polysaccharide deacetylase family protein [Cyanobacteria bac